MSAPIGRSLRRGRAAATSASGLAALLGEDDHVEVARRAAGLRSGAPPPPSGAGSRGSRRGRASARTARPRRRRASQASSSVGEPGVDRGPLGRPRARAAPPGEGSGSALRARGDSPSSASPWRQRWCAPRWWTRIPPSPRSSIDLGRRPRRVVERRRATREERRGRPAVEGEQVADVVDRSRSTRLGLSRGSRRRAGAAGSSVGEPATRKPGRLERRDLRRGRARAARDDRAGVAHPLALGRRAAGDERGLRDVARGARPPRPRPSSSAAPPISPIRTIASVSGSAANSWRTSRNVVPMTGSPPIPTHVDWPMPGVGHRLDGLVGERARARHDPDPALAVDRARDDPDLGPARATSRRGSSGRSAGRRRAGPPRRPGSCRAPGCPR